MTETTTSPTTPPAVRFANYPGDVAASFPVGTPAGPTMHGETMYAVTAKHDPETDTTRVGWSFVRPVVTP